MSLEFSFQGRNEHQKGKIHLITEKNIVLCSFHFFILWCIWWRKELADLYFLSSHNDLRRLYWGKSNVVPSAKIESQESIELFPFHFFIHPKAMPPKGLFPVSTHFFFLFLTNTQQLTSVIISCVVTIVSKPIFLIWLIKAHILLLNASIMFFQWIWH